MRAATLDQLARRGVRMLVLEQFGVVAHEHGSRGVHPAGDPALRGGALERARGQVSSGRT
jgi:hypothetical protein